jgi:hypothetical protein
MKIATRASVSGNFSSGCNWLGGSIWQSSGIFLLSSLDLFIRCGRKHFETLKVDFDVVTSASEV